MRPHVDLPANFELTALYTAFSATYGSDYFTEGETHDFWEIVIVTEGEIGVTAGKNVYYLKKGQAILHAPNEFHNLWSERNEKAGILIFTFSARHLPKLTSRLLTLPSTKEAIAILSAINEAFQKQKISVTGIEKGHEAQAAIAIKRLELFLLQSLQTADEEPVPPPSHSACNYAVVVRFLEENLHRSLNVQQIAEACRMSEVNLKKTFSRYAGMGVIHYLNRLKIFAAVKRLKSGVTVREVAESLGFLNQNYFCTVFTRIMGQSPKHYKG